MLRFKKGFDQLVLVSLFSLFLSTTAWAQSYFERHIHRPVPGGVAV